jgi:hypothetical protein
MRAPLLLPISLALLASFPALAQDAPKVIFCSGPCFAVDANGVRTPAPKGTELRPDQRFETGPGAYAQVKLGPDAAMALGDGARVRFDQKNFRDSLIVSLDVGRVRMIGGEAIGKPMTRPVELHTADGSFALRNADVEVKKSGTPNTPSALTMMKVNAGDARLRSGRTEVVVPKDGVRGFTAGKPVTRPIAITEIALRPPARAVTQPVAVVPLPNVAIAAPLRGDLAVAPIVQPLPRTLTGELPGSIVYEPLTKATVSMGDIIPTMPIITPTGEIKTLTTYVLTDPVLTSSTTTTKSIELLDTSTTLSSTSLSSISLTTVSTTSTDTTLTKLTTSPTTLTTTTTTTSTLSTSPTISTITAPLTLTNTTLIR